MNNVPLINNLTVNDINTALIAIKKNLVKGANGNEQLQDVDVNVDVNIAQNCTYCAADSTTIKGAELFQGCSIKVLFTSAITGSNTTSPLTINYNNVDITVKVGKNGTLADFVAYNTGSGFVYCQAYTTLELLFDGNNFVIMGNPVVISNSDYTVYTDGSITYSAGYCTSAYKPKPFVANTHNSGVNYEFDVLDGRYYYLTVIRSAVFYKYRIWYFGGGMFSQLLLSEDVNPIVSIDLNTANKCKVTIADWDYITVMWEEDSSGLY
jgi:hypothetical protein